MSKREFEIKLKYTDEEVRSAMAYRKFTMGIPYKDSDDSREAGRKILEEFGVTWSHFEAGIGHEAYYELYGEEW